MWKSITIKITVTNSRHHVSVATKYCMVVPNICGSSVWNLLLFTFVSPRSLKLLLNFWKISQTFPTKFWITYRLCFLLKKQIIFTISSMCVRYCADHSIVFSTSKRKLFNQSFFPILSADTEERSLSKVHCYSWKSSIGLATENHYAHWQAAKCALKCI
jgi:hypothetical protein